MPRSLKPAVTEDLTPIEAIADNWGVSTKTVNNWVEFIYQAFEIMLPISGPFPGWGVQLLDLVGKHISSKAALYFSETGEIRRLKGSEFINKIRLLRQQGHFGELQKFQNFRQYQEEKEELDELELENEALAEFASITRGQDQSVAGIKATIERKEDEEIDELINFLEDSDRRKMIKLVSRLKGRKLSAGSLNQTINTTYSTITE